MLKIKTKAFLIHLLSSLAVITGFVFWLNLVVFPSGLADSENIWEAVKILLIVDLVLGPLITFVIYKPNKKNLKVDITIIALLQLLALLYGGYVMYQQRPLIVAFNVKEFEVITAAELHNATNEDIPSNFSSSSPKLVYVLPPQNEEELARYFMSNTPIQNDPARYYEIDDHTSTIIKKSLSLATLKEKIKSESAFSKAQKTLDKNNNYHAFYLRGSSGNRSVIIIDIEQKDIIKVLSH